MLIEFDSRYNHPTVVLYDQGRAVSLVNCQVMLVAVVEELDGPKYLRVVAPVIEPGEGRIAFMPPPFPCEIYFEVFHPDGRIVLTERVKMPIQIPIKSKPEPSYSLADLVGDTVSWAWSWSWSACKRAYPHDIDAATRLYRKMHGEDPPYLQGGSDAEGS